MRVLIFDHDEDIAQQIKSALLSLGCQVFEESLKNGVLERISQADFDIIFVDCVRLKKPQELIFGIRRHASNYPYLILLEGITNTHRGKGMSVNDRLNLPIEEQAVSEKVKNAAHFLEVIRRIGDDSEHFPSAGGVISKSAFNQILLSAIDRAGRYAEDSFLLFITLDNHQEIFETDGPYAADYAAARVSRYLVLLRRQSDIIGQTGKHEYTLMLQRPQYEQEPVEATKRFAQSLAECEDIISTGVTPVEITLSLFEIPTGKIVDQHHLIPGTKTFSSE